MTEETVRGQQEKIGQCLDQQYGPENWMVIQSRQEGMRSKIFTPDGVGLGKCSGVVGDAQQGTPASLRTFAMAGDNASTPKTATQAPVHISGKFNGPVA
jgi:hypothetical protein